MSGVICIVLDDSGREQIPAYAGLALPADIPSMPNLDALAANGVRLDRFYATALCSPTRAALATGRYSFRSGMGNIVQGENAFPLALSEPALPKVLKLAGVRSALFGKFHLGNSRNGGVFSPLLAGGFDYHSGTLRNIIPGQGQTYYNWPWIVNGEDRGLCQEYATARTTTDAARWINRQGSAPFYAQLSYQCPHEPWNGPPLGTYDDARWGVVSPAGPPTEDPFVVRPFFKTMMENVDFEIGRLLASISPGILANTQVWVLGDNGTPGPVLPAETHPTKGPYATNGAQGKQTTFEPGVCLPCIVSGAGIVAPGRATSELVHVVDLWRTMARTLGLSDEDIERFLPEGRIIDSLDVSHILANVAGPARETIVTELFGVNTPNPGSVSGIRSSIGPRYKLRMGGVVPGGTPSFYDLDWLNANNLFETDPTADLTPGGVLTGLSDSDPLHPGERTAYFSLLSSMEALLATYDDDLIL